MIINSALRKRLNLLLPKDYRREIVDRLKERGIKVHPNTVSNALNGSDNQVVVAEILKLANERKALRKKVKNLVEQF